MRAPVRRRSVYAAVAVVIGLAIFGFSWFLRYNEPEGGFAGLLDDHYFYVVRGWQMLYGDLPDRDFVDIGAPLTYVLSALVQWVIARGTWSEVLLAVTMLSAAAAISYYAAWRASGSVIAALLATLFQIALFPRFYNYSKLITYALAIPATWAMLDRPSTRTRAWLAAITVMSLLLRHDHGVFIAVFVGLSWLFSSYPWRTKLHELLLYASLVLVALVPYLLYLAANGGIVSHLVTANAWSMRDRQRAPLRWPAFDFTASGDAGFDVLQTIAATNATTWVFYVLVFVPFGVLALLAWSRDAWRPEWPRARAKLAATAVLAIILNVGFLRGALGARLADVAVPHTVLIAWLLAVAMIVVVRGRVTDAKGTRRVWIVARVGIPVVIVAVVALTFLALTPTMTAALRDSHIALDPGAVVGRAQEITARFQSTWPLDHWTDPHAEGPVRLVSYLEACTRTVDRLFISQYLPQVPALARRAFAGGHPDLRPGFFATDGDQRLFLDRIRQQSVPILIVPPQDEYSGFASAFPLVHDYFAAYYAPVGDRDLGGGLRIGVWARRDRQPTSRYERLDLPCFQ